MELIAWLVLALVFLLGPIVLIHELGHFLLAKWAGVRVLEFGLGFPPRLLTLAQERGVLAVDGTRMVLPPRLRLPKDLKVGQQVEVLARPEGGETYRVLRVVRTEAPSGRQALPQGLQVRGALTVLEPGTRYSLNLLPAGAFVRMLGEEDPSDPKSLAAKPKRWRLATLLAGPLLNLLAALLILTAAYVSGIPDRYFVEVDEVLSGAPAEAAGLQEGDVLTVVNGERLEGGPGQLRDWIQASPGQTVTLTLLRAGEEWTLAVVPRLEESGAGFMGIAMWSRPDPDSLVHYSLPRAAATAIDDFVGVFVRIFQLPHMVAEGEVRPAEVRPAALPGILQWLALGLKDSLDWRMAFPALQITAMISLAFGLTNLLPLPALDGGRALFVLIETVRRRRIDPDTEAMIHMIGMAILLVLSSIVVVLDIADPLIPWSHLSP
jgi:regulator of sigma E protease